LHVTASHAYAYVHIERHALGEVMTMLMQVNGQKDMQKGSHDNANAWQEGLQASDAKLWQDDMHGQVMRKRLQLCSIEI
jgi:hypothetical protein